MAPVSAPYDASVEHYPMSGVDEFMIHNHPHPVRVMWTSDVQAYERMWFTSHDTTGDLLVVDWIPAEGVRPRAVLSYLFDGGTIDGQATIRLQKEELDDAQFVTWAEAEARMPDHTAARVPAARQARLDGRTVYLPAWRSSA